MKLKLTSKPFDIESDKVVLYPKSELTLIANITTVFTLIVFILIILVSRYVHVLLSVTIPLFTGAFVLYIYGGQELIFDMNKREIHRKTLFKDWYLGGFDDMSHIEMIIHPGYNIAHYRCFLKMAPNGMGIKLTINFKEDNKYFIDLSQTVIPILLATIPNDGDELVIPQKTIHDIVFFERIGNSVFRYTYLDYPAFFVMMFVFVTVFLIPVFTGFGYFYILLIVPVIMLFRPSQIIIDRNRKYVFTSLWWGFYRHRFSYADIKILGIAVHNTRGGFLGGSSIYAFHGDDSSHLLIKRMLMEERVPRLIQEIEVLMKHPGEIKN